VKKERFRFGVKFERSFSSFENTLLSKASLAICNISFAGEGAEKNDYLV